MRMRIITSVAAVCVALAAAGAAAAAQTAPKSTSDVDPGAVRYFDPEGKLLGRIEQSLPFDVQFYLRIPVDETVLRMSGRYVGDTDPLICSEAFPRSRLYVDYGFGPREVARSERRKVHPITFTRFVEVEEPQAVPAGAPQVPAGSYAELNVVRGLLPSRYYCFEFTRIRKPVRDPETFRQALADAVDKRLRGQQDALNRPSLKDKVYNRIRQDAIAAIRSLMEPGERLIIPSGSFLDEDAPTASLPVEVTANFDAVLTAQMRLPFQIQDIKDTAALAVPPLNQAVANPALKALAMTASLDPMPEVLAPVFRGKEASVRSFAGLDLSRKPLLQLATGQQALPAKSDAPPESDASVENEVVKPLEEIWLPADVEVLETNRQLTEDSLRDVQSLADWFAGNDEMRKLMVGGGDTLVDDLKALDASIGEALDIFEDVGTFVDELSTSLTKREKHLLEMVDHITSEIVEKLLVEGSTTADYEVRANWYLGMDLGVGWADGIEDLFTYIGTNIYFRPVNKKAPLRWADFRRGQRRSELMKRLSLTIGVVVNDLERDCRIDDPSTGPSDCRLFQGLSQENLTQGLIADKPMLVSGGLRISDFFRFSLGALVFKEPNPDPLVGQNRLAWSPLISFSVDWNVRGFLRNRLSQQPFPAE